MELAQIEQQWVMAIIHKNNTTPKTVFDNYPNYSYGDSDITSEGLTRIMTLI